MSDERRETERQNLPLEMEFWCDSTRHRGRIEDLSVGGAYVYSMHSWPVGQEISFSFTLPGSDEPIEGAGTLVWSEYMGFGVRFDSLDDAARQRIREVVGTQPLFERRGTAFQERMRAASG